MRRHISQALAAALAGGVLAGCATHPALMTREERMVISHRGAAEFAPARAQGRDIVALPPVDVKQPVARPASVGTRGVAESRVVADSRAAIENRAVRPAPHARASAPSGLPAEEHSVADAYWELRRFRDAIVALATALTAYDRSPSAALEQTVRRRFTEYQESAQMSRIPAAVLALTLTGLAGCNSIASQIRSLNAEEKEILERATAYQEHRKSIVALVAALEQVKRDGGAAKSERAVEEARTRYEQTEDRL
jgi:hypothetical protein